MKHLIACLAIAAGSANAGLPIPPDAGVTVSTLGEPSRTVRIPGSERSVLLWDATDAAGATTTTYAFREADGAVGPAVEQRTMLRTRAGSFDPAVRPTPEGITPSAHTDTRLHIVQFVTSPRPAYFRELERLGAKVLPGYMPDQAAIIDIDPERIPDIRALPIVRATVTVYPEFKVDSSIPGTGEATYPVSLRICMAKNDSKHSAAIFDRIAESDGVVIHLDPDHRFIDVDATRSVMLDIARGYHVISISRIPASGFQSLESRSYVGATQLDLVANFRGKGVRAEIFDSVLFLDTTLPGGAGSVAGNQVINEVLNPPIIRHNPIDSYDTFIPPPNVDDFHASSPAARHGTRAFGTLFARENLTDYPSVYGVLPEGQGIFNSRFSTANSHPLTLELEDDCTFRSLSQFSIDPAISTENPVNYRAVLQSASTLLGNSSVYESVATELDTIVFHYDFMLVRGVGNDVANFNSAALGKNVLSVGGINTVQTAGTDDDVATSVGRGPVDLIVPDPDGGVDDPDVAYGRIKPDLVMPAVNVMVAGGSPLAYPVTIPTNGVSFATPAAAGAAGLVFEMWGRQFPLGSSSGKNIFREFLTSTTGIADTDVFANRPGPAVVKALLINSATPYDWINGTAFNSSITRDVQGWGRPDLKNLYRRALWNQNSTGATIQCLPSPVDPPPVMKMVPEEVGISTAGGHVDRCIEVIDTDEDLRITLVWSDPPPSVLAGQPLVNDLDLRVTAPDGTTVYHGNFGLIEDGFLATDHGIWSQPGGFSDKINNVENVFIPAADLQPGLYDVRVTAAAINMDGNMPVWTGCSADPVDNIPPTSSGPIDVKFALIMSRSPCTADFDQNGLVETADSTAYTNAFSTGDLRADINCDGYVNFFDIAAFNLAFSEGCP